MASKTPRTEAATLATYGKPFAILCGLLTAGAIVWIVVAHNYKMKAEWKDHGRIEIEPAAATAPPQTLASSSR